MDVLVNVRYLLESEDEIIEFIQILNDQMNTEIPVLVENFEKKDYVSLKKITHKLKATFKNLDINPIKDYITQLDERNNPGYDTASLQIYYTSFMEEFKIFDEALKTESSKYNT